MPPSCSTCFPASTGAIPQRVPLAAALHATPMHFSVLERHVDPEDMAEACLFLASDRARNITGIELHVTAGQWI